MIWEGKGSRGTGWDMCGHVREKGKAGKVRDIWEGKEWVYKGR